MYQHVEIINREFEFLYQKGFRFLDYYSKSTDVCTVFVYRFERDEYNYVEFRCPTGGNDCNFVVCINNEKKFPAITVRYRKKINAFNLRHLFKKPTVAERWALAADIFKTEVEGGSLFGIVVK